MKKIVLLFCCLFTGFAMYAGGGWTREKGSFFAKVSQYSIITDYYFSPTGQVLEIPRTQFHSLGFYGEYGFTDKLTGIINAPLFARSSHEEWRDSNGILITPMEAINSLGDFDIALKYKIYDKDGWVAALMVDFGIPLGKSSGGNSGLLQTGDGEFNQLMELYVSKSVGKGYLSLSSGLNHRTKGYSEEFRYGLEAGRKFGGFWGIVRIAGVESFGNGSKPYVETYGNFTDNIEYLAISPEISYGFNENWGLSLSAGFAAFGKNVMASPSFSFGVYMQ